MAFDPDNFLADGEESEKSAASGGFDPDAFLGKSKNNQSNQEDDGVLDYLTSGLSAIHSEGAKSLGESWEGVKKGFDLTQAGKNITSGEFSPWQQFKDVGSGLLSAAGLPLSYPAGAARAVVGHPLAAAGALLENKVSSNPRSEQEIFEEMSPGIDLALGAIARRPRDITNIQGPAIQRFAPVQPMEAAPGKGSLFTKAGQELRAGNVLREAADDPVALAQKLERPIEEIVPGSRPTTFQATGDLGVGNLERAASARDPNDFNFRRGEQNTARLNALAEVQKTGSPEDVADFLRSEFSKTEAKLDAAETQVKRRAWEESHAIGGHHDEQLYGNIIRQELRTAEEAARASERELWNAVDPNGNLVSRVGPVRQALDDIYGNLTLAARSTLKDDERNIANVIGQYGPSVPFREMTDLRSAVSAAMRREKMAEGSTATYNRLSRLRTAIEDSVLNDVMDIQGGNFVQDAAERLAAASAATRSRRETFNAEPIGQILRRDGAEGVYKMQGEKVPGAIFSNGPSGHANVTAFARAVGRDNALFALRDAAVASARRYSEVDGVLDYKKLDKWAKSHQQALDAITEMDGGALARDFSNVKNASRAIEDQAQTRASVIKEVQDKQLMKLLDLTDSQDISRTIGGMFSGQNSVAKANGLARKLRNNADAMDGARRAIADFVQKRFVSNTEAAATEQNLISANQFTNFIKDNQKALLNFFSPEQIRIWQNVADDIRRANRSISSTKLPGGSNTPQDLYALKMGPQRQSILTRVLTSAAASLAAGLTTGSGVLGYIGGGIAANFLLGMREAGVKSVQGLINKALLDPAFARDILQKASPQAKMRGIKRYSMYGANTLRGSEKDENK